jgi:ribulose-5-phosphate 4-epimerase/fuculose-1-phosphate aldolase
LQYDLDGTLVRGNRDLPQEIYFYSVPLKQRPDINVVIHCHPPAAIAVTAAGGKIFAMHQDAIRFGTGVPVAPWLYGSWVEHGSRALSAMGESWTLMIDGHGALAMGATIEEACMNMVHLERTAKMILMASAVGSVKPLTPEIIRDYQLAVHGEAIDSARTNYTRNPGRKEWRYFEYMVKKGEQWPRL